MTTKLQEAATSYAIAKSPVAEIASEICNAFIAGATSPAAKEYWQKKEIAELKTPIAVPISVKSGEESEYDWNKLRDKFFKECTKMDSVDGYMIKIDYAPHDLFEWFKRQFATPTKEAAIKELLQSLKAAKFRFYELEQQTYGVAKEMAEKASLFIDQLITKYKAQ